jgi:uncharacterized Zn finger protein
MGWGWDEYPKAKPRKPANGIKAQSKKFGQTWWASRWLAALERLVDAARLGRGRSYARSGQVLNIDITPGVVQSRVQGSRPRPYQVEIQVAPLSEAEWARVTDAMAAQAIFAARLLVGEMPPDIEEAFAQARVHLFPASRGDLKTKCSCPDYANPCKHIAAVYYLLGEQFDGDPFLIFQLRGKSKEEIMAMLRARRSATQAATVEPPAAEPALEEQAIALEECLSCFWEGASKLGELPAAIEAPALDGAPVKRLGAPGFWKNKHIGLVAALTHAYQAVTRASLDVALGTATEDDQ